MNLDPSQLPGEFLEEFRQSTAERTSRLIALLGRDPGEPDAPEVLRESLRQLHSLKGEAGLMSSRQVSQLAHLAEELLSTQPRPPPRELARNRELLLSTYDTIARIVSGDDPGAFADEVASLQTRLREAIAHPKEAPEPLRPAPPSRAVEARPTAKEGSLPGTPAEASVRVAAQLAARLSAVSSELVISHARYAHGLEALRRSYLGALQGLDALRSELSARARSRTRSSAENEAESTELDGLGPVERFCEELEENLLQMDEAVHQGNLQAEDLERIVREMRLVPIAGLFDLHARAARNMARDQGKKLEVEIIDDEITMDRVVVERLAEPLLHLVRNAVDHAIETPEVRRARGKPETATLTLSGRRDGPHVVVKVADDGCGIDLDAVRRRALELGVLNEADLAEADEADVLALLFRPGFSTKTEATELSGRGIGLDVVKRNVELLGGTVEVVSTPSVGTSFQLHAPVNLALTRVLVVEERDELFAIPQMAVERVFVLDPAEVEVIEGRRYLRLPGGAVLLASLSGVVGPGPATAKAKPKAEKAILVRNGGFAVAFTVDRWFNALDVVVKPLGEPLQGITLVLGACVLERGEVAVVLNPAELVAVARRRASRSATRQEKTRRTKNKHRVLYAEDSPLLRHMVAETLRASGCEVLEAESGQGAFETLEQGSTVDLLLTDLDMPEVDGFELIRRVRSKPEWQDLPIVVLSSRSEESDKLRALVAGADAFFVKGEFSDKNMRELVAKFVLP